MRDKHSLSSRCSRSWISGYATRYTTAHERAVLMVSKPVDKHKCDQHTWKTRSLHDTVTTLTSSKQIVDDSHDLLIRDLNVGVLIQLSVLTVVDERICDVTDVVLKQMKRHAR